MVSELEIKMMNKWLLKANSWSKVVKLSIKKRNREREAADEAKIVAEARRIATQNRVKNSTIEREKLALDHEMKLQQADRDKLTTLQATMRNIAAPIASPESIDRKPLTSASPVDITIIRTSAMFEAMFPFSFHNHHLLATPV